MVTWWNTISPDWQVPAVCENKHTLAEVENNTAESMLHNNEAIINLPQT